jgi:hypothetical protein
MKRKFGSVVSVVTYLALMLVMLASCRSSGIPSSVASRTVVSTVQVAVYRTSATVAATEPPTTTEVPTTQEEERTTRVPIYIVYWGKTGTKYHIDPNCMSLKGKPVHSGTLKKAKAAGRSGWCGICSAGWTDEGFIEQGNPFAS